MNPWHDVSPDRIRPEKFLSVIEIPKGSKQKYEMDKETGLLRLDRVLYTSTHYPANYGFIPRTLSDDGDPLDALVLCTENIHPMTLVECCPIGLITMIDDNETDEKVIAVPCRDPQMNGYSDISQLPAHLFAEITHFFGIYKQLEHSMTSVDRVEGRGAALAAVERALLGYRDRFGAGEN